MWTKAIIHLDMDAFYPAVEVLDDPALRGRPVIVGGTSHRGVVASASYEARTFGVRSAMPIAEARRRCPEGVYLAPRMQRYSEISRQVFAIFERFTPLVEPLSIDEAFLDVTACVRLFGSPPEIAAQIKSCVREELNLTVSAGVASNKSVAKIASDLQKPDGLTVVEPGREREFLAPLPIERLWGAGPVTCRSLHLLGVQTIGDLVGLPVDLLIAKLGFQGEALHRLAQGIDEREVETAQEAKSIGNEETFTEDIRDTDTARRELLALAVKVAARLRHENARGRTICLKVKYADFRQITRSITINEPVDDSGVIYRECCGLIDKTDIGRVPVRLLGVSVSNLYSPEAPHQQSLFDEQGSERKTKRLNQAIDRIQDAFGNGAIKPATLLKKP
ncbi:MAG: DNA polymerase IV [Deltaproteobacteria bacterium]|nr:DNA polymerase IV [Deltaproteobacteria bacterium]